MVRAFKTLTSKQTNTNTALTGETVGQNIDDGTLTSYVKTQLASDKLVTLSRVGVETNNGVVYLTGEVETADRSRALDLLRRR
jgi:osmotically-inducible protein OsmY